MAHIHRTRMAKPNKADFYLTFINSNDFVSLTFDNFGDNSSTIVVHAEQTAVVFSVLEFSAMTVAVIPSVRSSVVGVGSS